MQIRLNSTSSKNSVNTDNKVEIELAGQSSLLNSADIMETIDEYQQYLKEKDASNKYRFVFTINPLCTNVLSNVVSEIVMEEGSDSCVFFGAEGPSGNGDVSSVTLENINRFNDGYTGVLYNQMTREYLIRNTSYSHPAVGPLVYHCGYDIFNNHTLRSKEYTVTNKVNTTTEEYNTIKDRERDFNGENILEHIPTIKGSINNQYVDSGNTVSIHSYIYDTIETYPDSVDKNVVESDGWFGFQNPGRIDFDNYITDDVSVSINRCMNNNKIGEQIDFYPDRSLYSFTPKYNKYRRRYERNWDYVLTYPYKNYYNDLVKVDYVDTAGSVRQKTAYGLECVSTEDLLSSSTKKRSLMTRIPEGEAQQIGEYGLYNLSEMITINEGQTIETTGIVYIINYYKTEVIGQSYSARFNGDRVFIGIQWPHDLPYNAYFQLTNIHPTPLLNDGDKVIMHTNVRHNLTVRNSIEATALAYNTDNDIVKAEELTLNVTGVGTTTLDKEHYFTIDYTDIKGFCNSLSGLTGDVTVRFRIRKKIKGAPCKYYIRIFKQIPNFANSDIYNKRYVTDSEIESYCKRDFNSSLNKMAFEKTIYNDGKSQIVYNEPIDLSCLKDNLGRPLTEVFLTIVKRNKGYEKWYGENPVYNSEDIEYSHCFGKLTAGFDFSEDFSDFNVHKIHNISDSVIENKLSTIKPIMNIDYSAKYLGQENGNTNGITIEGDSSITEFAGERSFFGDLVEFSELTLEETVLEDVYFRFNTAQREYDSFNWEMSGDTVIGVNGEYANIMQDEIAHDDYDQVFDSSQSFSVVTKPYNRRSAGDETSWNYPANIYPEGYYYKPHNRVKIKEFLDTLYQGEHKRISYRVTDEIEEGNTKTLTIYTNTAYNIMSDDILLLFKKDSTHERLEIPITEIHGRYVTITMSTSINLYEYVVYLKNRTMPEGAYDLNDGTGRYLWKNIKKSSQITSGSDLYNSMFTNGAHYFHQNINFFLKRQDPDGRYGLQYGDGTASSIRKFIPSGVMSDVIENTYYDNTTREKTC